MGGTFPAILWPVPCLDCPLAVEAISFLAFPLRFKGTALTSLIGYSLEMPETTRRFDCPNCGAEYKVVRAEADPPPDRQIVCRRCGAPLQGRDGKFILKYFLVGRPRTQAKAPRSA